jgi:hypothetical protein
MTALPAPRLRHVYRLDADLDAPIELGDTPQGHRRIVALTADSPMVPASWRGSRGGAVAALEDLYAQLRLVAIDEPLARRAGDLACAVHLEGDDNLLATLRGSCRRRQESRQKIKPDVQAP